MDNAHFEELLQEAVASIQKKGHNTFNLLVLVAAVIYTFSCHHSTAVCRKSFDNSQLKRKSASSSINFRIF